MSQIPNTFKSTRLQSRSFLVIVFSLIISLTSCKRENNPVIDDTKKEPPTLEWMRTGNDYYRITKLQFNGNKLLIATDGDGMFYSTDNAVTLRSLGIPGGSAIYGFNVFGSTIFAGVRYYNPKYNTTATSTIFKSTDFGFVEKDLGSISYIFDIDIQKHVSGHPPRLYLATSNGLRYSTDWGETWMRMDSIDSLPEGNTTYFERMAVVDSTVFLNSRWNSKTIYTRDHGKTWNVLRLSAVDYEYEYIIIAEGDRMLIQSESNDLFLTEDKGNTWSKVATPLSYYPSMADILATCYQDSILYCSTWDGIHFSKNFGKSWKTINPKFPKGTGSWITTLAVRGDTLFAGTEYTGIWKLPIREHLNF